MPKIEPFEEHSDEYEAWFEENEIAYKSELKAVRHFIPEGKKGMEIGIGSGRFARPLGIEIGVEPSEEMRKMAEEKDLEVYDAAGESLPFEDNEFDFVLMVTTICFLDDVKQTFKETGRVLKDNGLFIIGFVDKDSPLGQVYQQKKEKSKFYRPATFHSAEGVMKKLKKQGFKNLETVQTLFGQLPEIEEIQDFRDGHGEGGFVVVKAEWDNTNIF